MALSASVSSLRISRRANRGVSIEIGYMTRRYFLGGVAGSTQAPEELKDASCGGVVLPQSQRVRVRNDEGRLRSVAGEVADRESTWVGTARDVDHSGATRVDQHTPPHGDTPL